VGTAALDRFKWGGARGSVASPRHATRAWLTARNFALDDAEWTAYCDALDRPAEVEPTVRELHQ
jgi:uncharacterized protein (DUF1778 family)